MPADWKQVQVSIEAALAPIRKQVETGQAENDRLRARLKAFQQTLDLIAPMAHEALQITELTTAPGGAGFGARRLLQNIATIVANTRDALRKELE